MRIEFVPTIRLWFAHLRASLDSVPKPTDSPQGHGSGPDPDRILIIGSGAAKGHGVISHQLALPGRLADDLSRLTRRGADVDIAVERPGRATSRSIGCRQIAHYDAIVVTLGSRDTLALLAPRRWAARVGALVDALGDSAPPSTPILLTGAHSIRFSPRRSAGLVRAVKAHESRLNRLAEEICSGRARTSFVPLSTPTPGEATKLRASDLYGAWARGIAEHLAPRLPDVDLVLTTGEGTARQLRRRPQRPPGRHCALSDLPVALTLSEERFDHIVALARDYFRTSCAALTLSDDGRDVFKSKAGFSGRPGLEVLSAAVLESGRPLVISDAAADSRFCVATLAGGSAVGFYAGYPLEAPTGHRIGVLSVFDPSARDVRATDSVMLRDLAMMLQRELWSRSGVSNHA